MENLNVTLLESSSLHKEPDVVMCTRKLSAFSKLTCQNWRGFFGFLCLCLSNEENFIYITVPSAVSKDYPPNALLQIPMMMRWDVHLFNFNTCPFAFQRCFMKRNWMYRWCCSMKCLTMFWGSTESSDSPRSVKIEIWDKELWKLWGSVFAVVEHHVERFSTVNAKKSWN